MSTKEATDATPAWIQQFLRTGQQQGCLTSGDVTTWGGVSKLAIVKHGSGEILPEPEQPAEPEQPVEDEGEED